MERQAAIVRFWFAAALLLAFGLADPVLWFWLAPLFFWGGCPCCGQECSLCTSGTTADEYSVVFTGITNQVCSTCTSYNTTFVLTPNAFPCQWEYATSECGFSRVLLQIVSFFGSHIFVTIDGGGANLEYDDTSVTFPFDCTTDINARDIPILTDGSVQCSLAGSTCTLSAV